MRHMLKQLGGTDPLRVSLPMAHLTKSGAGDQTLTTTAEITWNPNASVTNSPETFRLDPADPAGLLVYEPGYYLCMAVLRTTSFYISAPRTVYQSAQPLSSGAGIFGNELGFPNGFSLGTGQGPSGIGTAPGPSSAGKSEIAHICVTNMGDKDDPSRYVVVGQHTGTDWAASSGQGCVAIVIKLSDSFFQSQFPEPPAA